MTTSQFASACSPLPNASVHCLINLREGNSVRCKGLRSCCEARSHSLAVSAPRGVEFDQSDRVAGNRCIEITFGEDLHLTNNKRPFVKQQPESDIPN